MNNFQVTTVSQRKINPIIFSHKQISLKIIVLFEYNG